MSAGGRLERRPVTRADLPALFALEVRADQRDLVAPNAKTLAEVAYQPGADVWGLWAGGQVVGLMAMIDFRADPAPLPGDDPACAYLWRLMIAAGAQGQGYGAQALAMALTTAADWGFERLKLGVADTAHSNIGFYRRYGFAETGEVIDGDRMLWRRVAPEAGLKE